MKRLGLLFLVAIAALAYAVPQGREEVAKKEASGRVLSDFVYAKKVAAWTPTLTQTPGKSAEAQPSDTPSPTVTPTPGPKFIATPTLK